MEKTGENKAYYRKDSQTNVLFNHKDRHQSRSVYTNKSLTSIDSGSVPDSKSYDAIYPWLPRTIANKNICFDDYGLDLYGETSPLYVSHHGVITLRLENRIRVDIALDRGVRVMNPNSGIIITLSGCGSSAALIHPNGRVFQYGSRVDILVHDSCGNNKIAKMWSKGVSFTSEQCALVYLLDSAGTHTTTDTFNNLHLDFSLDAFLGDSHYPEGGSNNLISEACNLLQVTAFWRSDDGTCNWLINNIRISQTSDGLVRVGRNSNMYALHTSPTNGSTRISTPFLHCTGSMGQTRHLFVRHGDRRMHYDGASFIVRNAGQSAGFDDKHQLKVY